MLPTVTNITAANLGTTPVQAALPTAALENLAARCRPAGLCLMLLQSNDVVTFYDQLSETFFQRYAAPLIQSPKQVDGDLQDRLRSIRASSPVQVWNCLPGLVVAAIPYVVRRQMAGVFLLVGKSTNFKLSEDVVRICGRLGLDGIWLHQQADQLPAYSDEAIHRQARLVLAMLMDQLRLSNMENDLNSLSNQLANTYEELSLIYQISGGMRINRRPTDFFKQTCVDSIEVMGVRGMGVVLKAGDILGDEPLLYGGMSIPAAKLKRLGDELLSWMTEHKTSLLSNSLAKDKRLNWIADHAQHLLAVPLQRGEEVLGVLFAVDKERGDFDSVDSKLLNSIANESAIYLENAVLFEDVHGLMMGLLHSLTSAVDAKDAYTCGHSERVALLSKMLAKEAGLTEQQVDRIYMAGLLHDVGKIGVPESVLQKPGRLTAEEFDAMKKHPAIGARILSDVKQVKDILPGVMHHHERYDGKGYPDGLAGQNIPLMGRIICLADCFDAMTSTRTYRKALPLEVALADIRRCSGTQFDPALTEAFLKIDIERFREILRAQETTTKMDLNGAQPATCPPLAGKAA